MTTEEAWVERGGPGITLYKASVLGVRQYDNCHVTPKKVWVDGHWYKKVGTHTVWYEYRFMANEVAGLMRAAAFVLPCGDKL